MRVWLAACLLALPVLAPRPGHGQGIDCSRARSPTEKAICGSPALLALDHEVALAYAGAVARQPDLRDAMHTGLLAWLRSRDAACNVPAAAVERCLSGQLTARLAALAPPPEPAATASAATGLPGAARPPANVTPLPAAAASPAAPPAIPDSRYAPPQPAAALDAASLPPDAEADTLLHVSVPGRFSIAAHSPSGAALQLVDMLAGPTDLAGSAGTQDGRLDQLLDVGTYKLRVFSAAGATGPVRLGVTPFHDAAPAAALPGADRPLDTTLRDGEQRAFWLLVPPGPGTNVRIEAAGRALADLRLWRDGRDLAALAPEARIVTPVTGHPLQNLRLTGTLEPGSYLAVAYGGPALPWTDSDGDQPFHLRGGASPALADGWAGGTVGPFGSETFALPAAARLLRLDLPQPAAAELRAGDLAAGIAKDSREPSASLAVPQGQAPVVELRAAAGQRYTLRAVDAATQTTWSRPGSWWVSAATAGMGGDEVPPTLLLLRRDGYDKPPRIVASTAPVLGRGAPYRARFNLRGRASLLFQTPDGGDLAFTSSGVDLLAGRSGRAAIPPGYVELALEPKPGALGSLEVVVGTPGSVPPPLATPLPADPVIPLGVQTLAQGESLLLDAGSGAGASIGLVVRAAPVALVEGPLVATVAAGSSLSVPVLVAPGGTLSVSELGAGPIAAGQADNTQPGRITVVIPLSDRARTVVLAWHRTPGATPAVPSPTPPGQAASVTAGTPRFLDLARGEERGFALSVPEGGLFRLETLGRLHTAGRLATPFIPRLAAADGNGTGQNFLIQSVLRAGRYRVDVRALDSAGHLGLLASPAAMLAGSALVPGGSVRASLPAGSGIAFPVEVAGPADGRYHLDVLSLGTPWQGRLEDAEGWPLTVPGALDGTEAALRPGRYRLVVDPATTARDVVARLAAITKPVEITGHGPHPLPFEAPQTATWREPASRDAPRAPDIWAFTLAGPAEVTLTLADGMAGELHRAGSDATVAKVVTRWTGTLEAGDYRLLASSLGRNDRLSYSVGLGSPALQPGAPRSVSLPASLPFSLAAPRVVSLTSWGVHPVKAVLRTADGGLVGRYGSRAGDWNIAVSRRLAAGRYVLDVRAADPPSVSGPGSDTASASDDSGDTPDDDDQAAQTAATQGSKPPNKADAADTSDTASDATPAGDDAPAATVSVRLTLPATLPDAAAPAQAAALAGDGVHVLSLPQPAPGTLLLAAAASPAPVVLALERAQGDDWQTVGLATGRAPVVAAPADGGGAAWRVETWAVDGGSEPIRLAARALALPGQSGAVALAPVDGMPAPVAVGRAHLPGAGIVGIAGGPAGLHAGGWPGHALVPAAATAVASDTEVWLVAPQPGSAAVAPLGFAPGQEAVVRLPAGQAASLQAPPAGPGQVALWRVASGAGQPSLGMASGIAAASTVVLAGEAAEMRGGGVAMRLRIIRETVALLPARALDAAVQLPLPPGAALPLTLPPGSKSVQLELAPGLAAFAGWHDAVPVAVWTGADPVSRTLQGGWPDLLLVNTGQAAAPARVALLPSPDTAPLRPGSVLKRFFGAAGSFALPFNAPAGSRLVTAGNGVAVTAVTAGGITDGTQAGLSGPGRAVVRYQPGPVAVWLDAPSAAAWPTPPAQPVSLPARVALSGPATALTFTAGGPALLHLATSTPVFAGLQQGGRTDPPALFANGAELHRAVAAGPVTVTLYPAGDAPLGGTATLWAETLIPLGEGLGERVAVAPGGTAAFGFTLAQPATVGVGLQAEPDSVTLRLLDARGTMLGEGVAQLRSLQPGAYVLEAQVPAAATPAVVRPALVGITPRGDGPPPDVVQTYLELVGMKPQKAP